MDYQTYPKESVCAPAEVKRMVENRARHTFGEPAEEYNAAHEDGEDAKED